MNEIWKPAPGYEQWLEVSSLGRVRSLDYLAPSKKGGQPFQLRKGGLISCYPSNGYPRVDFLRLGKKYRVNVHRLIALAFVPGHFEGASVDHINFDRNDNRAENLRWLSLSENTFDQLAHKRGPGNGENHHQAKLTDKQADEIFEMRRKGIPYKQICQLYGVSRDTVYKIAKGMRGRA